MTSKPSSWAIAVTAATKVRARAVTGDRELPAVPPEAVTVGGRPVDDSVAVGEARGEGVLRCQPEADRDHPEAALLGERPGDLVVRLQAAEEERAAVEVDEQPVGLGLRRRVEPHGYLARRRARHHVLHREHRDSILERRQPLRPRRRAARRGRSGPSRRRRQATRSTSAIVGCTVMEVGGAPRGWVFWPGKTSLISSSSPALTRDALQLVGHRLARRLVDVERLRDRAGLHEGVGERAGVEDGRVGALPLVVAHRVSRVAEQGDGARCARCRPGRCRRRRGRSPGSMSRSWVILTMRSSNPSTSASRCVLAARWAPRSGRPVAAVTSYETSPRWRSGRK